MNNRLATARPRPLRLVSLLMAVVALAVVFSRVGPWTGAAPSTLQDLEDGAAFVEQMLSAGFLRSLDTMKESRDLQRGRQLSDEEIAHSVALAASLNVSHIALATHWEYPTYLERWVRAARAANLHVWFRGHPERWTSPGDRAPMTPAEYCSRFASSWRALAPATAPP